MKTNQTAENSATATEEVDANAVSNEEKLERAKNLLEKKRKEKDEENERVSESIIKIMKLSKTIIIFFTYSQLARERELQRRRMGQDLQNFKQRQEETDMKKLQEERKRDKIEEQAVRKRILEQIALDKAERAQRFTPIETSPSSSSKAEASTSKNSVPSVVSDSTIARIQFKKPNGEIDVKTFSRDDPFSVVRTYVEENVIVGSTFREFALATTFPRHEFKADDDAKTVLDLGLVPSSVKYTEFMYIFL